VLQKQGRKKLDGAELEDNIKHVRVLEDCDALVFSNLGSLLCKITPIAFSLPYYWSVWAKDDSENKNKNTTQQK